MAARCTFCPVPLPRLPCKYAGARPMLSSRQPSPVCASQTVRLCSKAVSAEWYASQLGAIAAGEQARAVSENCARGLEEVITQCFPLYDGHRGLVSSNAFMGCLFLCGPGWTGKVGLAAARRLAARGVAVAVVAMGAETSEECGVDVLDFFPRTFAQYYDVVVDCVLGAEAGCSSQATSGVEMQIERCLAETRRSFSLVTVDYAHWWQSNQGRERQGTVEDEQGSLQPDVLISQGLPVREASEKFRGSFHFITAPHLQELLRKSGAGIDHTELPSFPRDQNAVVLSSRLAL
ncbi:hypothetical protein FVE85_6566 [Porphyridium purpureum]|uniref:YjeF N-terminal domain-containing protein n=1 Tax=Porphyridium purpureum TaxID=35688 RepID=A0A5J4Z527_PORPP|nr:hypothetical protein FVE85_6566 [Porphyridium purpureum]|eukprot:POR3231..scf295_1